jgi:hypothetical protein
VAKPAAPPPDDADDFLTAQIDALGVSAIQPPSDLDLEVAQPANLSDTKQVEESLSFTFEDDDDSDSFSFRDYKPLWLRRLKGK